MNISDNDENIYAKQKHRGSLWNIGICYGKDDDIEQDELISSHHLQNYLPTAREQQQN